MKRYKIVVLLIFLFVMCASFHMTEVNAETITGRYGKNITWKLEGSVLTIAGKGDMPECGHKKLKLFEGAIACDEEAEEEGEYNGKWYYTEEIETVVIEEGVTSIAAHAFFGVGNIKSISIPSSVKKIGHAAFACSEFREIIVPDSVTSIGEGAFFGCSYLERITLPKNLKKIRKMTFNGCYSLKEIHIPQKVQSIGEEAFDGCGLLKEVEIPRKVKTIGVKAFYSCDGLEKVNWEGKSTLQNIGLNAFSECSIKKMTIPASVKKIDGAAVSGTCEIQVDKNNKKYKSKNGVLFSKNGKTLVCYPSNKKGSTYTVPKGVKTIGIYGFSNNSPWRNNKYLKKVIMPDSVTVIKEGAFAGLEKLKTVRFSKKLQNIEEDAFMDCKLTSLVLPESLIYIGKTAFNCSKIKGTIVIPKNVKTIKTIAFFGMNKIKKVVIKSKKLKEVDKEIFWGLKKNSKVYLPKSKQESYQKFFTKKRQGKNIKFVYK